MAVVDQIEAIADRDFAVVDKDDAGMAEKIVAEVSVTDVAVVGALQVEADAVDTVLVVAHMADAVLVEVGVAEAVDVAAVEAAAVQAAVVHVMLVEADVVHAVLAEADMALSSLMDTLALARKPASAQFVAKRHAAVSTAANVDNCLVIVMVGAPQMFQIDFHGF